MPNWLLEILIVWNYRTRSLWLLVLGFTAVWLIPAFIDWYWSTVELQGIFSGFENIFAEAQDGKFDKRGLIIAFGCWVAAYRAFKRDKKKLMKHF